MGEGQDFRHGGQGCREVGPDRKNIMLKVAAWAVIGATASFGLLFIITYVFIAKGAVQEHGPVLLGLAILSLPGASIGASMAVVSIMQQEFLQIRREMELWRQGESIGDVSHEPSTHIKSTQS